MGGGAGGRGGGGGEERRRSRFSQFRHRGKKTFSGFLPSRKTEKEKKKEKEIRGENGKGILTAKQSSALGRSCFLMDA